MGGEFQGYAESGISITENGIRIWLPKQVFGKIWLSVVELLFGAIERHSGVVFPQTVMTQQDPVENAPCWRQNSLDVLSWLLFVLKVPANHELVRLWHKIDWRQINRIGAQAYSNARGGRPAWAPAQLVAVLILMFLHGIAHETAVIARVQENIIWCWFCGFGLFGPFPTHDALYELRKRMGTNGFEQLLTMVVHACLKAGLIGNELVHFDMTPVIASAHRWSPYERAVILSRALMRYLELVWTDQQPSRPFPEALRTLASEIALEILPHKGLKDVKPEQVQESVKHWEAQTSETDPAWKTTSETLVEELVNTRELADRMDLSDSGLRAHLTEVGRAVTEQMPHTRGDLDARVGRTTSYTWFCGYLVGFVVDNLAQIITAVVIAVGNVKQAQMAQPALSAHIERVGVPRAVAMDSAFDDPSVHSFLDGKQIQGFITSRDHFKPRDGGYGTDRVDWIDGSPTPVCPSRQPLLAKGAPRSDGTQIYEGTACANCPLYKACCPSGEGEPKRFSLKPEEHRRWQKNRENCQTEAYKGAQKKRFVSEGRFGLAKQNHRATRAPYRSVTMNYIAGLIIAMTMNLRILAGPRVVRKPIT